MIKIRTIITQDAEVDDQNSLRHFLFYANEVELQGIVQTSSKFHWKGIPGAVKPEKKDDPHAFPGEESGPFDRPYRWTGTDWMFRVIDDYEKDYSNLIHHADGYPTADYLRSITKIGNIGYEGEMEGPTEGSELIRKHILDEDPRPLYLQVWGGTNTIAQALKDIQVEYESNPGWAELHERIQQKVIITACGEQDGTYRSYIAEQWPKIMFVKTLQMCSYAYPWFVMPECASKDTLKAEFMKREILNGKSALASGYCTWQDGKYYEGEPEEGQFGANPEVVDTWFGAKMGMPRANQFDFLSEGDSPTFFLLFSRWGLRTLENFAWGGVSGRYYQVSDQFNSKGEALNCWDVRKDSFTGRDGKTVEVESMWPYVEEIQKDFAARIAWAAADTYERGEHAPELTISGGCDINVKAGEQLSLQAEASSPDGNEVKVSFRIYPELSMQGASVTEEGTVTIPENARPGDQVHVIVKATEKGYFGLSRYAQVVLRVEM